MTYASPGDKKSTHHVVLSSTVAGSAVTIGLILCDGNGAPNPRSFTRNPINQSSLKTYQGTQRYADLEPPWTPIAQTDWSGGRGSKDFDRDATMYFDGYQVNTNRPGEIILGGNPTSIGETTYLENTADSTYTTWDSTTPYIAFPFTSTASFGADEVYLTMQIFSGTISAGLATISSSKPDSITYSSNTFTAIDTPAGAETLKFVLSSSFVCSSGTTYALVVKAT